MQFCAILAQFCAIILTRHLPPLVQGHIPGVTIAIMGCIVNGPGEMADADFGYVGGAPGKVDLYVGKEVVRRSIPNDDACDQLIELIKEHGMWKDKEEEEEAGEEQLQAA